MTGFGRLLIFGNELHIRIQVGQQGLWVPYAAGHKNFFSTNYPNELWNPPRLIFSRYKEFLPYRQSGQPLVLNPFIECRGKGCT